jgi:hypothetical protein
MKRKINRPMKRILSIIILIFLTFQNYAQNETFISLSKGKDEFEITNNSINGFNLNLTVNEIKFSNLKKNGNNYIIPEIEGFVKSFDEGKPNIPTLIKLIEIPFNADVKFDIKSYDEQIIKLSDYKLYDPIIPAQRSQSKSEDDVPLIMNKEIYENNDFYTKQIISFDNSGILRSSSLGQIEINLIQYNPVKNIIKIINNLEVEIIFENADHLKTAELKKKYSSVYFDDMLKNLVINDLTVSQTKELITESPVHYVIVSDRMFENQLEPLVNWKVKKGFKVTVGYTDEIGSTTSEIKSWLQNIYEGSDPMSFVLFVGDVQQIPAWNGSGSHITDLRYCEYTGDDIPEVYYGRFSAQTTDQLQPQIDKTLLYEQYLMSDPSYLENNILIAGVDAGYAPTHGNGAINYATDYYFNPEHNINPLTYLFNDPTNSTVMSSENSGASSSIVNYINQGVGFANYTAHCSPSGWYDPSFETSNVASLTNNQKYGLWIGNCCESMRFEYSECFGESGLRKVDGGAIGVIGGSNNTYWDEDYWWGIGLKDGSATANPTYEETGLGAYDGIFHDKVNEINDISTWFPAQGQINMAGNLAVQASSSDIKTYYWEIYHLMGDPSLMPYMGIPNPMTVSSTPEALLLGMTTFSVSSAPYTYVALSQNGVLIDAAVSDVSGIAVLNFDAENIEIGTADLVVTGQNKIPYIGTINVYPADQPYVAVSSFTTSLSPDYGETISLNVSMKNLAEAGSGNDAYNVESTLFENDDFVIISDNIETYGDIAADAVADKNNAFEIILADDVSDQHEIQFNIINEGADSDSNPHKWYSKLHLTVNAPEFTINELTIDDASGNGNGILDVGETADLQIRVTNTGHADANNVVGYLSTSDFDLSLNNSSAGAVTITANGESTFVFNVTVSSTVEIGSKINVEFVVRDGQSTTYVAESDFELTISESISYCTSIATDNIDSIIDSVRFGNSIFNGTASECATYSDFTNLSADVIPGTNDTLIFVLGTCGGDWEKAAKVFIDWNGDKDFEDAGEHIHTSVVSKGDLTDTVEVFVPIDALPGKTIMRIVCKETTSVGTISSCGTYTWGETEDYTLNIMKPVSEGGSLISEERRICTGSNTGQINLVNYTGTIDDWQRRVDGGAWIPIGNSTDEFNETLNDPGLYEYRVSVDGGTFYSDTLSIQVDELTAGGTLSGISDICENGNTGEILLSANTGYVQKWIKKLDDGVWTDINTSSTILYDELNESGTWHYRAIVKNGTCEVDSSEVSSVVVNPSANAGIIDPEDAIVCSGDNINLQLINYEGSIQWMESDDCINWNEISGAVTDGYTTPTLTEDHFYKAVVSIPGCEDGEVQKEVMIVEQPVASFDYSADNQNLSFTSTSTNATGFDWDFGDGIGTSANRNPDYSYTTEGTYTVILEVSNGVCPNDIYSESINVSFVGLNLIENEFKVSPNPNHGLFRVDLSKFPGEKLLKVYSLTGKTVFQSEINSDYKEIDLSKEMSGVYFLSLVHDGKSYNKKLIIK